MIHFKARAASPSSWIALAGFAGVISLGMGISAPLTSPAPSPPTQPLQPKVELEETVYEYQPANNGAGPLWCHGSTCLIRIGEEVFASGLETIPDAKPLNNCRWTLFHRSETEWKKRHTDASGRTREPCPLVAFSDGRFFLSANPTLTPTDASGGPARPEVFEFKSGNSPAAPKTLVPIWKNQPAFTEHSYRSFAADGPRRELVLFQNIGYTHAEWSFMEQTGKWPASGQLKWPWGADYAKPQPIRVCYPNVALFNRSVHFCGVSDIVEPNPKWREYKKQLTGQHWDYDFRRLFYTWSNDITTDEFHPWIEIASREETGGWITPGDLWIGPDQRVHLLWTERALDERLRKEFFPQAKQSHALNYVQLMDGQVILRKTLLLAEEGGASEIPGQGRFHAAPDHRLYVLYYVSGRNGAGQSLSENRLLELSPDGNLGHTIRIPLKKPFTQFFTATPRGGTGPSNTIDLLGQQAGMPQTISYARINLRPNVNR